MEKSAQAILRNTRELRAANAYFERGHVVSSPCNIRGGGIGANNGTPAPATKQHSAGTTSSALSTGPQFVSVLLHNTRCGAVTRMRDEVLRCLITPPPATILPCRQPFEEREGEGDRIGEQRLYARGIRLKEGAGNGVRGAPSLLHGGVEKLWNLRNL